MYAIRPKQEPPWRSDVLVAHFSDVAVWFDAQPVGTDTTNTSGEYLDEQGNPITPSGAAIAAGTVEFTYVVENRGTADYSTSGSSIVAMVRRPDGLVQADADIHVRYP